MDADIDGKFHIHGKPGKIRYLWNCSFFAFIYRSIQAKYPANFIALFGWFKKCNHL